MPEEHKKETCCRERCVHVRGFTLIEMLVIIIIMAIVSSIIVPNYSRTAERARYDQTIYELVNLIAWSRDMAIQNSSDTSLSYDTQTDTIDVNVEPTDVSSDVPTSMQDMPTQPSIEGRQMVLGENLVVVQFSVYDTTDVNATSSSSNSTDELHFHEDGSSNGLLLHVKSLEGYGTIIEVSPSTGRVVAREDDEE